MDPQREVDAEVAWWSSFHDAMARYDGMMPNDDPRCNPEYCRFHDSFECKCIKRKSDRED